MIEWETAGVGCWIHFSVPPFLSRLSDIWARTGL